jgi:hypothetical protein
VKLPYDVQGLIYFTAKNYKRQPQEVQERILRLCERAGGDNAEALFVLLTTHRSVQQILMQYHIGSQTTLDRAVRRYYELWEDGSEEIGETGLSIRPE